MATNNTSEPCWNVYLLPKYKALLGLRSSLSLLSAIFILCMLGIIILFKKYVFFTQRLILYLAISTFSFSLFAFMDLGPTSAYTEESALIYCEIIGFFQQITLWWIVLATTVIMVVVFIKVVFKRNTEKLESLYAFIIFGLPFVFNWIPIIKMTYGPVGYFCWIRNRNIDDCTDDPFGYWLSIALYFIPVNVIMVTVLILLIVAFVFAKRQQRVWQGKYSHEDKQLQKQAELEIRPLIAYPLIFIITNLFSLLIFIFSLINTGNLNTAAYVVSVITTIVFRFQGILITLVFTLDPETRHTLKWHNIRVALRQCFRKSEEPKEYPVQFSNRQSFNVSLSTPYTIKENV